MLEFMLEKRSRMKNRSKDMRYWKTRHTSEPGSVQGGLIIRRRIKTRLPFAGIIRRLPYSTSFQNKG